jgi:hypothetical protein
MIIKLILTIIVFFLGIADRSAGISVLGNPTFFIMILLLGLLILVKNKYFLTVLCFAYFLGVDSNSSYIGLLPLIFILLHYSYFFSLRTTVAGNKITIFLFSFLFFLLNFIAICLIINSYRLQFSPNLVILIILVGIVGAVISLFSNNIKYDG